MWRNDIKYMFLFPLKKISTGHFNQRMLIKALFGYRGNRTLAKFSRHLILGAKMVSKIGQTTSSNIIPWSKTTDLKWNFYTELCRPTDTAKTFGFLPDRRGILAWFYWYQTWLYTGVLPVLLIFYQQMSKDRLVSLCLDRSLVNRIKYFTEDCVTTASL